MQHFDTDLKPHDLVLLGQALESGRLTRGMLLRLIERPWLLSDVYLGSTSLWKIPPCGLVSVDYTDDLSHVVWVNSRHEPDYATIRHDNNPPFRCGANPSDDVSKLRLSPSGDRISYIVRPRYEEGGGIWFLNHESVSSFVRFHCAGFLRDGRSFGVSSENGLFVDGKQFGGLGSAMCKLIFDFYGHLFFEFNDEYYYLAAQDGHLGLRKIPEFDRDSFVLDPTGHHIIFISKDGKSLFLNGTEVKQKGVIKYVCCNFLADGTLVFAGTVKDDEVRIFTNGHDSFKVPDKDIIFVGGWSKEHPIVFMNRRGIKDREPKLNLWYSDLPPYRRCAPPWFSLSNQASAVAILGENNIAVMTGDSRGFSIRKFRLDFSGKSPCSVYTSIGPNYTDALRGLQCSPSGEHIACIASTNIGGSAREYVVLDGYAGRAYVQVVKVVFVSDNELRYLVRNEDESLEAFSVRLS